MEAISKKRIGLAVQSCIFWLPGGMFALIAYYALRRKENPNG